MKLARRAGKVLAALGSPLERRALALGVGVALEHTKVLRRVRAKTVVDVGANRGQFALAVRRTCPEAVIHAFEPLAGPADVFRKVFAGEDRVRLQQVALGSEPGAAEMYVSERDDSSSLLPIGAGQVEAFPGTEAIGRESVPVAPLSDVLKEHEISHRAMLKIDVQGFEAQVLRGCEPLLARFDYIYMEASLRELYVGQTLATELWAWLFERDFKCVDICNISRDKGGVALQADFLFARQSPSPHALQRADPIG